jgi:hypothetical protein
VDIEIKNKLLEVIRGIRAWNPEEDTAETLLTLCDEFSRVKPDADISLEDWTDITQLGWAAEYKRRVDKKSSYPIWACDFDGNCIVGAGEWSIEHIDEIDGEY